MKNAQRNIQKSREASDDILDTKGQLYYDRVIAYLQL